MSLAPEFREESADAISQRYAGLKPAETKVLLHKKYTRRLQAIHRFTERMYRNFGFVDDAEIESLRAVGVSKQEIRGLIESYAGRA